MCEIYPDKSSNPFYSFMLGGGKRNDLTYLMTQKTYFPYYFHSSEGFLPYTVPQHPYNIVYAILYMSV